MSMCMCVCVCDVRVFLASECMQTHILPYSFCGTQTESVLCHSLKFSCIHKTISYFLNIYLSHSLSLAHALPLSLSHTHYSTFSKKTCTDRRSSTPLLLPLNRCCYRCRCLFLPASRCCFHNLLLLLDFCCCCCCCRRCFLLSDCACVCACVCVCVSKCVSMFVGE